MEVPPGFDLAAHTDHTLLTFSAGLGIGWSDHGR
jgi:hypothetical protein